MHAKPKGLPLCRGSPDHFYKLREIFQSFRREEVQRAGDEGEVDVLAEERLAVDVDDDVLGRVDNELTADEVRVSFDITNTGRRDGDEVAQVYVHYPETGTYVYYTAELFGRTAANRLNTNARFVDMSLSHTGLQVSRS